MEVLPIAEARANLSRLVAEAVDNPNQVVYLGSHRKPQAVLLSAKALDRVGGHSAASASPVQLQSLSRVIERLAEASQLSNVRALTTSGEVELLVTAGETATFTDIDRFQSDMAVLLGQPVSVVPDTSMRAEDLSPAALRDAVRLTPRTS